MIRHDHRHGQYVFAFEKTISTVQAADLLKTTSQTVRRMLESGELIGRQLRLHRKGSPWLVYKWSVEAYIAKQVESNSLDLVNPRHSSAKSATSARGNGPQQT